MMQLRRHPHSPPSPARSITAKAERKDGHLTLVFAVTGTVSQFALPVADRPGRRDGLWRHTCVEAFVGTSGNRAYLEFNFSPAGDWAAYRFDDYRSGMAPLELPPPSIEVGSLPDGFAVTVAIDLAGNGTVDQGGNWRINLSAVIEAVDGSISHWALAHPAGAPDFHHSDCFVLDLPPAHAA